MTGTLLRSKFYSTMSVQVLQPTRGLHAHRVSRVHMMRDLAKYFYDHQPDLLGNVVCVLYSQETVSKVQKLVHGLLLTALHCTIGNPIGIYRAKSMYVRGIL